MPEIDVRRIMEEIRQEALTRIPEEEKLPDTFALFKSIDGQPGGFSQVEYDRLLMLLNHTWSIELDRPLVRGRGLKGFVKYLVKKISRKLMRGYLKPAIEAINTGSAHNVNLHNQLAGYLADQTTEIARLKAMVEHLQSTVQDLQSGVRADLGDRQSAVRAGSGDRQTEPGRPVGSDGRAPLNGIEPKEEGSAKPVRSGSAGQQGGVRS